MIKSIKTILEAGLFITIIMALAYILSAFAAWDIDFVNWSDYTRMFFLVITASMYSGFVKLGNKNINE